MAATITWKLQLLFSWFFFILVTYTLRNKFVSKDNCQNTTQKTVQIPEVKIYNFFKNFARLIRHHGIFVKKKKKKNIVKILFRILAFVWGVISLPTRFL